MLHLPYEFYYYNWTDKVFLKLDWVVPKSRNSITKFCNLRGRRKLIKPRKWRQYSPTTRIPQLSCVNQGIEFPPSAAWCPCKSGDRVNSRLKSKQNWKGSRGSSAYTFYSCIIWKCAKEPGTRIGSFLLFWLFGVREVGNSFFPCRSPSCTPFNRSCIYKHYSNTTSLHRHHQGHTCAMLGVRYSVWRIPLIEVS